MNELAHADTGQEVAARAADNNQGCGRIDIFRVVLESSKVARLDLTVDLDNRPARYGKRPDLTLALAGMATRNRATRMAISLVMTCRVGRIYLEQIYWGELI